MWQVLCTHFGTIKPTKYKRIINPAVCVFISLANISYSF